MSLVLARFEKWAFASLFSIPSGVARFGPRAALLIGLLLLSPVASTAGDLETAQEVAEAMRSGGMKHYSVGVGCKDGKVTLRGTVASHEQRRLALAIAERISTSSVVDQLQITGVGGMVLPGPPGLQVPAGVRHASSDSSPPVSLGSGITLSPVTQAVGVEFAFFALRQYLASLDDSFDVELDDGSRIVAQRVLPGNFELGTELGTLSVPLRLVESVHRPLNDPIARVRLKNGDLISGRIGFAGDANVRVISKHGEISVAASAIVRLARREPQQLARN